MIRARVSHYFFDKRTYLFTTPKYYPTSKTLFSILNDVANQKITLAAPISQECRNIQVFGIKGSWLEV